MNTKLENKICANCGEKFEISSGDLLLYEKIGLKVPNKCFYCRLKHLFAFSVFGKFRKGVSNLSNESLITILPANSRYPIYTSHEWWGDDWDAANYGQDYDSSRPFFEQLKELQEKVPRPHQAGKNNTNCDWCDDVWDSRNCYLCRSLADSENIHYCYRVLNCRDSFDLSISFFTENSYDCLFCFNSFNLNFSENSRDCIDSYFLFDCRNCQNCFMSSNLRNKQYYIRNKQYTKEEYFKELEKIHLDSYINIQNLKKEFSNMVKNDTVHRENLNILTTNSTGNYLDNCDKCSNIFTLSDSQNVRNSLRGLYNKDCIDQVVTWKTENSGNNSCVTMGYDIKNSAHSIGKYSEYLDLCDDVEYCFGCVGLKKKKYCILNKQYTKEEYEKLKDKIIKDMGDEYGNFLPFNMALCDYNYSTGFAYFADVEKGEILKNNGYWLDEDLSSTNGMSSLELPDSILDTDLEISLQALICPESKFRFNISKAEYEFHKRKGFALPRLHFDVRTIKHIRKTSVINSWKYQCFYCHKDINAYYPPEWGYNKIACEECYKQNIA